MTQQGKPCACGAPRTNGAKCKECYNEYMRDYMRKYNKTDTRRNQYLKATYGITLDEYNQMLAEQGGLCALCGSPDPIANKNFEVDHDHSCCEGKKSCGKCVRALLCSNCNTGIARFKDDQELLRKAITYLDNRKLRGPA